MAYRSTESVAYLLLLVVLTIFFALQIPALLDGFSSGIFGVVSGSKKPSSVPAPPPPPTPQTGPVLYEAMWNTGNIVGTEWLFIGHRLEFRRAGKAKLSGPIYNIVNGSWSISGNALTLSMPGAKRTVSAYISGWDFVDSSGHSLGLQRLR